MAASQPFPSIRVEIFLHPYSAKLSATSACQSKSFSLLNSSIGVLSSILPEMAVQLSIAFDTLAESCLYEQIQYGPMACGLRRKQLHVSKLAV
jgi:hypothetical protein